LDHAEAKIPLFQTASQSVAQGPTKFVLRDLKIEGDVDDRYRAQEEILKQWQGKEDQDAKDLAEMVVEVGVRNYFQQRGYFKVMAHDPLIRILGVRDGKQEILVSLRRRYSM
jgi:hypothetical protein